MRRKVETAGKFIHDATSLWGRAPMYITRLFRYISSSIMAVGVDLLILFILIEFFQIFYLISAAIAFSIGHALNYLINWYWVFKGTHWRPYKCFVYFFTFGLLGLALTVVFLALIVELSGLHYLSAKIIVVIIVGLINFMLNYKYTFKVAYELPKPKIFSHLRTNFKEN